MSVGGSDVWAAGYYEMTTQQGTEDFTLTEHWTGTRWTVVGSPSPTGDDVFSGLAAVSASDIWAVGGSALGSLVARWNGQAGVQLPEPNRVHSVGGVGSVSASSATDVLAAGGDISLHDYSYHTLIENLCPS